MALTFGFPIIASKRWRSFASTSPPLLFAVAATATAAPTAFSDCLATPPPPAAASLPPPPPHSDPFSSIDASAPQLPASAPPTTLLRTRFDTSSSHCRFVDNANEKNAGACSVHTQKTLRAGTYTTGCAPFNLAPDFDGLSNVVWKKCLILR